MLYDKSVVARGMADLRQGDGMWSLIEKTGGREVDPMKAWKHTGPGRDTRIACESRDPCGSASVPRPS